MAIEAIKIGISAALIAIVGVCGASAQTEKQGTKTVKIVKAPRASIERMKDLSPEFGELTDKVLFDDIWNRPGLSARDKSLITITTLVALGRTEQIESHMRLGIENGLTEKEISAAMTHIAFYAGWPVAVSGLQRLKTVRDEKVSK